MEEIQHHLPRGDQIVFRGRLQYVTAMNALSYLGNDFSETIDDMNLYLKMFDISTGRAEDHDCDILLVFEPDEYEVLKDAICLGLQGMMVDEALLPDERVAASTLLLVLNEI